MTTIKTIAIIGAAGKMGSAIARSLQGKYRLLLMSRDEAKLVDLKAELSKSVGEPEVYAVSCAREAAWEADVIIIATPYASEKEVADKIREVAIGKIVISISNPLDTSHTKLRDQEDSSFAEELQKLLPYSKVVKTFNTNFAANFMTSVKDEKMVNTFIAGNSSEAVEAVSKVVAAAGLSPVVIGDITMSRMLERMQLTLVRLAMQNKFPVSRLDNVSL